MGSCVNNGNDIIEMRTNNLKNNFKHPYNLKNNKKYKTVQLSPYKINHCQNSKKSKKSLLTYYLSDIPEMKNVSDVKDNVSDVINNSSFREIIEVFNLH